jgi:hypothetical protein
VGRFVLWLLLCGVAHAEPIYFDPLWPMARPMVPIAFGDKRGMAALDTGSSTHVVGARLAGVTRNDEVLGFDWAGWPIEGTSLDGAATVFRWRTGKIFASEWAERPKLRVKGMPHTDAVISPQLLPRDGNAIVIDFVGGTIDERPWAEARARVKLYPLLLAEVRGEGQFHAHTNLGDLIIDTGAPTTLLYEARDPELPQKAVQRTTRFSRLRVGQVDTQIEVEVLQPLGPRDGGLLGMDVLRDCAIALDRKQLVARCVPR